MKEIHSANFTMYLYNFCDGKDQHWLAKIVFVYVKHIKELTYAHTYSLTVSEVNSLQNT